MGRRSGWDCEKIWVGGFVRDISTRRDERLLLYDCPSRRIFYFIVAIRSLFGGMSAHRTTPAPFRHIIIYTRSRVSIVHHHLITTLIGHPAGRVAKRKPDMGCPMNGNVNVNVEFIIMKAMKVRQLTPRSVESTADSLVDNILDGPIRKASIHKDRDFRD